MRLVIQSAPRVALPYTVLLVVLSILPPILVWLSKVIVDQLAGGTASSQGALVTAGIYLVLLVVAAGLRPVQTGLSTILQDRATAAIDQKIMRKSSELSDLSLIERPSFQDTLQLLRGATNNPPHLFGYLQNSLGIVISLAGLMLLLGSLHPLLPIGMLIAIIPHLIMEQRMFGLQWGAMLDHTRSAREMDYCVRLTTEAAAAKELRVFNAGPWFLQRFKHYQEAALHDMNAVRLKHLRLAAGAGLLHAGMLGLGFWYVANQTAAGRFSFGDLALYLNALIQTERMLVGLPIWQAILADAAKHLHALFNFLDTTEPSIKTNAATLPIPQGLGSGFALDRVRFHYPEQTKVVLEDISLHLRPGQITALVGVNGAGKSTIVKLLTRMYDPVSGAINLDGQNLASYDLAALRTNFAAVYQDFARFALSLEQNITVSTWEQPLDSVSLEQAAAGAGVDRLAAKLPNGYATRLGKTLPNGVEISGGEWQKVALARSFMRQSSIIVLDEPTSALDAEAEDALIARFRTLMVDKVALLISHRLSTVRLADQILIIEDGVIVEHGTHVELIALNGRYAELFEMQAGRYRTAASTMQPVVNR
jgi:ATP-binding cassette subfamily B protein